MRKETLYYPRAGETLVIKREDSVLRISDLSIPIDLDINRDGLPMACRVACDFSTDDESATEADAEVITVEALFPNDKQDVSNYELTEDEYRALCRAGDEIVWQALRANIRQGSHSPSGVPGVIRIHPEDIDCLYAWMTGQAPRFEQSDYYAIAREIHACAQDIIRHYAEKAVTA